MKLLSKFKHFSKDIKLIIITTLIMSCFGVYAAGTCIIGATADDIDYNNTTVKAAIDELYSLTQTYCPPGYECKQLNFVRDCDNNILLPTAPNNLTGLAKIMAEEAYLDNGKSEYVTSCSGVSFNAISSDTNGKGVYEIASTKNDTYPIYYYRGAVNNNNVRFGGFCWKAIRTTDTGGVKLIYNGTSDGSGNCTNTTGTNTQIGTESSFNSIYRSPEYVGYMNGSKYTMSYMSSSYFNTSYVFGNNVTYSGGTYTLTSTMTSTGTWSTDYNTLNNNHYTCFTTGNTCTNVYYVYYTNNNIGAYYITLTNGNKISDAIDDMFNGSNVNATDSNAKTKIDSWYGTNLSSYTNYIEDTIYCNDRSISQLNGWNPNGGDTTKYLFFNADTRSSIDYTPSLMCSRTLDRFTVSSSKGNGVLTYPVGLITNDELMYAGAKYYTDNTTFYLNTNQSYWTISPGYFGGYNAFIIFVNANGTISGYNCNNSFGLRPVISLKSTDVVASGDGTQTNPYVIATT